MQISSHVPTNLSGLNYSCFGLTRSACYCGQLIGRQPTPALLQIAFMLTLSHHQCQATVLQPVVSTPRFPLPEWNNLILEGFGNGMAGGGGNDKVEPVGRGLYPPAIDDDLHHVTVLKLAL